MIKALIFYLTYFQQKRRLEEVWASYLIQGKGTVSLSLIRRRITLNFYSLKGLSSKEDIADHINQAFPYFKADSCIVKLDKMIFKTSNLPLKFSIPKNYKTQNGIVPIGCDEDHKIIQVNTNNFVSLGLFCFSGSGKTTFLKDLIKFSKKKDFLVLKR